MQNHTEQSQRVYNTIFEVRDSILNSFNAMSQHIDKSIFEIEDILQDLFYEHECSHTLMAIEKEIRNPINQKENYRQSREIPRQTPKNPNPKQELSQPTTQSRQPPPVPPSQPEKNILSKPKEVTKITKTQAPVKPEKASNTAPKINVKKPDYEDPQLTKEDIARIQRLKTYVNQGMTTLRIQDIKIPSTFSSSEFYKKAMNFLDEK